MAGLSLFCQQLPWGVPGHLGTASVWGRRWLSLHPCCACWWGGDSSSHSVFDLSFSCSQSSCGFHLCVYSSTILVLPDSDKSCVCTQTLPASYSDEPDLCASACANCGPYQPASTSPHVSGETFVSWTVTRSGAKFGFTGALLFSPAVCISWFVSDDVSYQSDCPKSCVLIIR